MMPLSLFVAGEHREVRGLTLTLVHVLALALLRLCLRCAASEKQA